MHLATHFHCKLLLVCSITLISVTFYSQPLQANYCGDGIPDPGEECDDGNTLSGDGCSAECTIEDLLDWNQYECDVDAVDNTAGGLFNPGDGLSVISQNSLPIHLESSGTNENGNVGLYNSPLPVAATYSSVNGGQVSGQAIDKLQGVQDGVTDGLAIGGFGTNIELGDWQMVDFFAAALFVIELVQV